jgi:hypothetical protein
MNDRHPTTSQNWPKENIAAEFECLFLAQQILSVFWPKKFVVG